MRNWYVENDLAANPFGYFATAAGPDISDVAGPPGSVLDIYPSGEPMSAAESGVAAGRGGGPRSFFRRGDVHALILMGLGGLIIHWYASS